MSRGSGRVARSTWAAYLRKHLDRLEWTNSYLADEADLDRSLVGRWINGTAQPTVDSVRRVCKAFRRDIREGLIAAGLLTRAELHRTSPDERTPLNMFNDDELLRDLRRRLKRPVRAPRHEVATVPEISEADSTTWAEQGEPEVATLETSKNGTNNETNEDGFGFNGRPNHPASQ